MINYKTIKPELIEGIKEIPYSQTNEIFAKLYKSYQYKFLFESKDISHVYGRLSLIGIDPVLKISGKNNKFSIEAINKRGNFYLKQLSKKDLEICDNCKIEKRKISGTIKKETDLVEETERSKRKNIAQVIRILLNKYKIKEKSFLGFYGAFSYDFIRLFEEISNKNPQNNVNDFTLFLYDTFIFFDHLKNKSEIIVFRNNTQEAEESITRITAKIANTAKIKPPTYKIKNAKFNLSKKEYGKLVETAR
ncbi:MAG: hypothetical protein WC285_03630, partial [Candidatus Gracilibacteria bacterium]